MCTGVDPVGGLLYKRITKTLQQGATLDEDSRKFTREQPERRRMALIDSTLDLVAEEGLRGATVRRIADRAQVTQGLIRHYFPSKEDLIVAAYEHHMTWLTDRTFAPVVETDGQARDRLAVFVRAALSPPVVAPRSVALWSAFLNSVLNDPQMHATHERTYSGFRDKLERLIGDAFEHEGRPVPADRRRRLAIACNAVIDGLWLEGAALADAFEAGELVSIGLDSVGTLLGIELMNRKETT